MSAECSTAEAYEKMSESDFADYITENHDGFSDMQMRTVRAWISSCAAHARRKGWAQGWLDAAQTFSNEYEP